MSHQAMEDEYTVLHSMRGSERLEYFVARAAEAEEVWGLGNPAGWILREQNDGTSLPVWPYQKFARSCAEGEWRSQEPSPVSLEHFVFKVLKILMQREIQVEVMPTPQDPGFLIDAYSLFRIFESTIESGEYFLEQW